MKIKVNFMKLIIPGFVAIMAITISCAKSGKTSPTQPCKAPTGLTTSLITDSSATISWTGNGATSYDLQYKPASSNSWNNLATAITATTYQIKGLSASTEYDWKVKANCSSDASDFSTSNFTTVADTTPEMGLAAQYPGDANIEKDPSVLFAEKFSGSLTDIFSRYDDKLNTDGMSLDADVPTGSASAHSIKMTSVTGGVSSGGHLFKEFSPGFDSVVYVRYYVKYPSSSKGYFHHESVWFGGYNPPSTWPNPQAGTCGLGDKRIGIAFEPVWQDTDPPGMDTYLYWGDMHSYNGGGGCYGNPMISEGATDYGKPVATGKYPVVAFDQWMCVEVMIKLNNPVTEYNGELEVWINGVKAGHWGPGFPNGHWNKDKWYNNPADAPFQGFRWRTDANLNINTIWLEYYHDNPAAPSSYIKYSDVIMATKYIGPIK